MPTNEKYDTISYFTHFVEHFWGDIYLAMLVFACLFMGMVLGNGFMPLGGDTYVVVDLLASYICDKYSPFSPL